jgi:hypothetical protein
LTNGQNRQIDEYGDRQKLGRQKDRKKKRQTDR